MTQNRSKRGLKDIYKFYREQYPFHKIKVNKFNGICRDINLRIAHAIITESFEFKLPYRLGFLSIVKNKQIVEVVNGKIKPRKANIDWGLTRKTWKEDYPGKSIKELKEIKNKKLYYRLNEHTDGYIMKFKWSTSGCNVPNYKGYKFKPVAGGVIDNKWYCGKRGLKEWIMNPDRENDYYLQD